MASDAPEPAEDVVEAPDAEPDAPAEEPAEQEPAEEAPGVVAIGSMYHDEIDDLTGAVDIESVTDSSVSLVAIDDIGERKLANAIDRIDVASDAIVIVGSWRGESITYRNRSRTDDDRLRVTIGVRSS